MRRLLSLSLLAVLLALPTYANTGPRTALVIGNAAYRHLGALRNPANDARDMAGALEALGFEVTTLIDATFDEMDEAVFAFGQRLGDRGGVGLFYYAGHGVEADGVNYLVPVEQEIRAERELRRKTIPVDAILEEMEYARNGTNIIILDACRDNPLPEEARSASSTRGLSIVQAPSGSLVVYATSPGNVAQDGRGRNGVFTGSLLDHIATPDVNVTDMLVAVRNDVMARTGNEQTPWENSSLTGPFYFAGGAGGGLVTPVDPTPQPDPTPTTGAVAQLYIETEPMGATAYLDGRELGPTPVYVDEVALGREVEIAAREGTFSGRESLRPTEERIYVVRITLQQETGNIVFLTGERGLSVTIDGDEVGVLESGRWWGFPPAAACWS